MRKKKILAIITAVMILALSAGVVAGKHEAVYNLTNFITEYLPYANLDQNKVWGAYLDVGDKVIGKAMFYPGNNYHIIATGDSNVEDVDMAVVDENGNIIWVDEEYRKLAYAKFSPRWAGPFVIVTVLSRGSYHGGYVVEAVMFE